MFIRQDNASKPGSVDKDTDYWYSQAWLINSANQEMPTNQFIRATTEYGLLFDQKDEGQAQTTINHGLQLTSNLIGQNVLQGVLDSHGIQTLSAMISGDIAAAVGDQASSNYRQQLGGWGGTFYYWDVPMVTPNGSASVGHFVVQGGNAMIGGSALKAPANQKLDPSLLEFYYANGNAEADFLITRIIGPAKAQSGIVSNAQVSELLSAVGQPTAATIPSSPASASPWRRMYKT